MTGRADIRLGAMVPYPVGTTPSQRYRIEQWAPELAADGIRVEFLPFADEALLARMKQPGGLAAKALGGATAWLRAAARTASAARFDAVLVHRAASIFGPAVLERAVATLGVPVIFDFDDAIFLLHTSHANRGLGWLKFPGKTKALCRLSAHVVAGNEYLADYARQYNGRVSVIPSSVDTDVFVPAARGRRDGRVVVGWTGSSTSQTYLEAFAGVLAPIARREDVRLRVHSDREPVLPGVPYEWRPWSPANEAEEIASFDVGIMPMPHDRWASGKCSMKALLYMAAGVATVCESVGMNREVINHGENGLLAGSPEEWASALESLVTDAALRARLGAAGRRTVAEKYSKARCAARFASVVRGVAGAPRGAGVVEATSSETG